MTKEKFEDLKSKIQKEGFTQPIIIDKETNNVLDGQNRLLVAQDLDIKDVPVVYMNNPTKTELKEKIKELEKQYIPIKEVKAIGLKEEPIIEEPLKEEPLKEEPIESEEERKGISKEAIYNRYGFAKKFKTVHDKDLVIDVMDKLETSANKKGISTEQEAENIVEKIKNKKIRGTASQFEILASAYHLENLDKQIEKLNDLGEDPTPLLEKRQKALEVLRELGKNSGSNLRLFSNAYKVAEDGKLQIFRARLKNSLGVDIIPTTKSELAQSNLSAEDKAKVAPYVQEIENVKNELNKIKKESEAKIQKENTKEIKNYVDKEITKTETSAKLTIEEAKKAAKKLRNIADNVENFLKAKGAEGAETAGIDIQKKIAQAIRYVADKIEKGEVPDLIVRAINKFASEDLSEKELRTHITDALTEAGIDKKLIEGETTKDKAINKIIKIAKEEKSNIITKSMSDKGLINDVVNHYIHLNTPYDEVIKEATSELKKHLPDVEETDVENAILKKGEFKQQTKQELKSEIKQKQEDVKRLANTNLKVKALQVISNIKEVENDATLSTEQKKIEIEKRKSDYEKSLDKKISDNEQEIKNQIEKDKQSKLEYKKLETERNRQLKVVTELTKKLNDLQAGIKEPKVKGEPKKDIPEIEALKVKIKEADSELKKTESAQKKAKTEAENLKNKIKDIEDEIKHVQDERTVYNKEIKNPNEVNQKLKEFKDILQQEYAKIGIRKESGSKTEIKIAQDSQNAIDEIKNSDLPDDVKKEHIKDIENQRDEQLRNTKQGVLVNLKDAIDLHLEDLKSKLDEAEKNDDKETFKKTNEVLKDLQRLSDALKPNAENLKDQIDKADQDLNAILKYNKGNEFESDLKKIQDEYRESWQKTSDELQAAELLRKSQRSQAEAERKLAGGQYTEIPTTQYDVSRNKILAEQQAEEEKAWSKLNSMAMEARKQQKEKSVIAKILEARKQILVASFTAIEKVLGSAITKPIIDPIIKQSFGRLSSLITKIRPTELRNIGETYRQLKNEESARQFMSKVNDDYIDAIVKYQKDKGTPNEKEALIKLKEAEIDNNAALAYLFINANSAIDIMQIMKNGATEFDSKMGKYKQSFPEQRTKIENIRFWLEGVNRSHAAMKSISHRQALLDHYIENLQYFQDKKGYITDESRHQAWDAATLSSEEGRFGENTYLSDLISKGKNSKSEALKNLTNFSLPVAKIGINITKQGLDMAFPGELGYKVYDLAGKGTKMNEAQGKEYSNAFSKWKDGIKTAFESLPLKEKKQINTLLFRGMFGVAQYALIGYLLSNKSIKYGGSYDENDPFRKKAPRGSDGRPLKAGEWEINGKRQPTIINMIINHSPYALPASLAAVSYNQMTSRKESERHYYKIFGKVVNEVYERLPIAGALDIGKALMGADEYKFNRLVANEVPSMKNVAEFTDKDAQGNPIKRKTKTIGEMIKANYPVLRQTLPRKY